MELGRLARLSPEERHEFAQRGAAASHARQAQIRRLAQINEGSSGIGDCPPIGADVSAWIENHLTPQIAQSWWTALDYAHRSGDSERMKSVLVPITALCPALAPGRLKLPPLADDAVLPSNVDFSHLSDEELARIADRPLEAESMGGSAGEAIQSGSSSRRTRGRGKRQFGRRGA